MLFLFAHDLLHKFVMVRISRGARHSTEVNKALRCEQLRGREGSRAGPDVVFRYPRSSCSLGHVPVKAAVRALWNFSRPTDPGLEQRVPRLIIGRLSESFQFLPFSLNPPVLTWVRLAGGLGVVGWRFERVANKVKPVYGVYPV